ncbi:PHP domain-containing protein [Legionella dresdenensis]|uniref:PHP domain-containing protein n=1 Tax=Legionella dresdenensis TaxID=450200 RepID=A0ABV8CC71_9GAMM
MIDLHCHSIYSDGALMPEELLAKASQSGLKMLALTDHDTVEGSKLLIAGASRYPGLRIVGGIELSVRWKKHDIHILGLNINTEEASISDLISQQVQSRKTRAMQIADCMALLGIDNAFDKACAIAGHDHIARPHFAQLLINEGKVKDMQTAFKRFLARGKPAYVPTQWISLADAVNGIAAAGGSAVIAHPLKYGLTRTRLTELIIEFKSYGGCGIEVVSGEMTEQQVVDMAGLCNRFDLSASTGSDFHNDNVSRISLGRQRKLPLNCKPVWEQWNT